VLDLTSNNTCEHSPHVATAALRSLTTACFSVTGLPALAALTLATLALIVNDVVWCFFA
jgi:hypothetical protein